MAGMKRFVTYIYSYEERKKGDNAGFARIEIRGEDCRIEVHLRAAYIGKSTCKVYLFREDAGDIAGYPIGDMTIRNGNGDLGAVMKTGQAAGAFSDIYQVDGLIVIGGDERIFLSRWKEGVAPVVSMERFRIWEPEQPAQKENAGQNRNAVTSGTAGAPPVMPQQHREKEMIPPDGARKNQTKEEKPSDEAESRDQKTNLPDGAENPQDEKAGSPAEAENPQDPKTGSSDSAENPQDEKADQPAEAAASQDAAASRSNEPGPRETENVFATEIPMRNIFPEYDWPSVWERLTSTHPVFKPFEDKDAICIQIELKDLRELPRRYWYLGNNSFLLHGFFNYRYLVVGRTGDERWFIGVPGIYQRQERVMAAIFGFPEFITAAVQSGRPGWEEELRAAELRKEVGGDPVNQFGCWYRFIEE